MTLRRIFLGFMLASFATAASAADKQVTLQGGDKLTMRWGTDWVVGETPPNALFGTMTVRGAAPSLWRLTLSPLPPHPTLTGDVGNLRIYVRNMSRGLENGGVDVDQEQRTLEGSGVSGFYFKARDVRPKTKAQIKAVGGEYTDTYTGALSINSRAYLFEVVWSKGGETAANAALAALKTVRIN
jgi:hypothetical protein